MKQLLSNINRRSFFQWITGLFGTVALVKASTSEQPSIVARSVAKGHVAEKATSLDNDKKLRDAMNKAIYELHEEMKLNRMVMDTDIGELTFEEAKDALGKFRDAYIQAARESDMAERNLAKYLSAKDIDIYDGFSSIDPCMDKSSYFQYLQASDLFTKRS